MDDDTIGTHKIPWAPYRVIAHEMSHYGGTVDTFSSKTVYTYDKCKRWVEEASGQISTVNNLIADCVSFFLQAYRCSLLGDDCIFESQTGERDAQALQINILNTEDKMKEETDLKFSIQTMATDQRKVMLTLTLHNYSPTDFYIPKEALLLDGFVSEYYFSISGPQDILCFEAHSKVTPNLFLLKSGDSKSNTLSLSDICMFANAQPGLYTFTSSIRTYHLYDSRNDQSFHEHISLSDATCAEMLETCRLSRA